MNFEGEMNLKSTTQFHPQVIIVIIINLCHGISLYCWGSYVDLKGCIAINTVIVKLFMITLARSMFCLLYPLHL